MNTFNIIIFLDVDGVLNCSKDFDRLECKKGGAGIILCDQKIQRILDIQKITDAEIVLSSTWRIYEDACKALKDNGINWIDKTVNTNYHGTRAEEILGWINLNKPRKFIIIDDDNSPQNHQELEPFHVHTSFTEGFLDSHKEQALQILGVNNAV